MTEKITSISLKLEVAGVTELMIYVTKGGTLNRLGGGEEKAALCMGRSDEPIVEQWLEGVDESVMELAGRYTLPDAEKGDTCYLEIALSGEEIDTGFAFTYGSEGMGPPEEMQELSNRLVSLTDDWYEAQLAAKRQR